MYKKVLFSILLVFFVAGCSTKYLPIRNQIASERDLDLEYLKENYILVSERCSNTKQRWFYGYIPLSGFNVFNDDYVIDEMLTACGGEIATNVEIHDTTVVTLIANYYGRTATADVWRRK